MQPVPTHNAAHRPWPLLAFALLLVMANSGCVRLLANAIYLVKGRDLPAEFAELQEKKVVVLVSSNGVHSSDATNYVLARNVNMILQNKVKKIQMVSQDEVDRFIQNQQLGKVDPNEIGARLGADYVIDIDVEDLKLYDGQTLYKGQCSATVTTYQCKPTTEVVFRKVLPEFSFPRNGTPVTDTDEASFRRFYLMSLAERVSRVYYPYDPSTDVAREASISTLGM